MNFISGKTPNESKRSRAPAFTFGGKYSSNDKAQGPGPASYNTEGMTSKGITGP